MQRTADFHHDIADALFPQPDPVFDNATALHTPVDMLDAQPPLVQRLVGSVLLPRELLAAGFLGRHEDLDLGQRAGGHTLSPRGRGHMGGASLAGCLRAGCPLWLSLLSDPNVCGA
jgi:hypothetical protein